MGFIEAWTNFKQGKYSYTLSNNIKCSLLAMDSECLLYLENMHFMTYVEIFRFFRLGTDMSLSERCHFLLFPYKGTTYFQSCVHRN